MRKKIIIMLLFISSVNFGQIIDTIIWTESEKKQYTNLVNLVNYVENRNKSEISKDILFENYVYFDYVLNDTNIERREKREAQFDTVFYYFRKTIDSLGFRNLDAKPVRFFKNHKIYKPFDEKQTTLQNVSGNKMFTNNANVFAYYKKEEPDKPLGVIQFEDKSNKLGSWILINQGGYHYFFTFSLL